MANRGELLIRGGTVIDPAINFQGIQDILVQGGEIAAIDPATETIAAQVVDATGCYVFPGLIDYHTHLFQGGTHIGVHPDSALLPQGVTTAVDQGSAGIENFERFFDAIVARSQVRIYCHLHVVPEGLRSLPEKPEAIETGRFDPESARTLFEKYADRLLGLKIRQSREIVGEQGLQPLKETIRLAEAIDCPVVVHTTNPPAASGELAELLRPGDVFTHMYQGKGRPIVDDDGELDSGIQEARARGVLFDTADGRGHYSLAVAKSALAAGFAPDIISTDLTSGNVYDPAVFGLPLIMAKYLALGLPLFEVVKACTATPAAQIGRARRLGTLQPGAFADIAVFRLEDRPATFTDFAGESLTCRQLLVPQLTVCNGKVAYRSLQL